MARRSALKRKSFFVDEHALRRAKKVLGVTTDAEVVRLSVARVSEMEEFVLHDRHSTHAQAWEPEIALTWRGRSWTPASTSATGSGDSTETCLML